jgi:peptidoglycan/xylan/chitin deacetylase (PgdA/CDA1 family)
MNGAVPILLYHSVSDHSSPRFRRWTIGPERFTSHMSHLASAGYEPVTVSEYAGWLRGEREIHGPAVVITFDDGFADFGTAALPIMQEHGMRSTLYLTTGYVGGRSEWLETEGEGERRMLDWPGVQAAAQAGVELGAHGHSHRQFDTLPTAEAAADLERSRLLIEANTGGDVPTAAYPHGYSTPALRRAAEAMGFAAVCGVKHAMSGRDDDRFSLARVIVAADTDLPAFRRLLDGQGLRVAPRTRTARAWAWRAYRRARRMAARERTAVPA